LREGRERAARGQRKEQRVEGRGQTREGREVKVETRVANKRVTEKNGQ
jgi:hypothetical protein